MPHSLRIEAFKELKNYSSALIIEPFWWYQAQLEERYKFNTIEETPCYVDYVLELTKELLEQINNEELKNIDGTTYNSEGWRKIKKREDEKFQILRDNFESFKLVRVNIYEIDSTD